MRPRHPLMVRFLVRTSLLLAGTGLALHAVNAIRLDLAGFTRASGELLRKARHTREAASRDYQAGFLRALPANPMNGPVLRLDDGLAAARVLGVPGDGFQPTADARLFAFEFDGPGEPGLAARTGSSQVSMADGMLTIRHAKSDYLINSVPLEIPKRRIGRIVIRARADRGERMTIGWDALSEPVYPWRDRLDVELIADGQFHVYEVDVSRVLTARDVMEGGLGSPDPIRALLLRPSNVDQARVDIDFIRFVSTSARYAGRAHGVDDVVLDKEMRRALYMVPSHALEYSIAVPEGDARLVFGTGILEGGASVRFEAFVEDGSRHAIYSEERSPPAGWKDAQVDLAPWAGREIRLILRVSGSGSSVAFWSHPAVFSSRRDVFNVILIVEDTLRADHISAHGYERPTTPFKDRFMAESGVDFLNAVSQAVRTRPSVPSMMTGLLPSSTGVETWTDMLDERYLTLAEILRSQGFATGAFVQNGNAGPNSGVQQGFETLVDFSALGMRTEDTLGGRALQWIDAHSDRNFFLYLHVIDPHGVYDPPPPFDAWYREAQPAGESLEPENSLDPTWLEHPTAEGRRLLYDGEIRHNDEVLARFMGELARRIDLRHTLVILTSDHGEYLGEHGLWEHVAPAHIQVVGVPLMMSYPARLRPGARIEERAQLLDVMPTVLELAGIPIEGLPGHGDSLVSLMEGREPEFWRRRVTVAEEPIAQRGVEPEIHGSLFFGRHHFLASPALGPYVLPPDLRTRVYDLRADPAEGAPLSLLWPDLLWRFRIRAVLRDLKEETTAIRRELATGREQERLRQDPAVLEQLRGLGYVD